MRRVPFIVMGVCFSILRVVDRITRVTTLVKNHCTKTHANLI
ncbi:hypothetical protein HNP55_001075 [Paucibacter oligotrophus]|uniref:Uncharacterized protein n=1 Tax=Roseateles oligotrophus TaxID=1769250 RepID=A0A840L2U5_9BURK|nr:hypothetical protein [Roseateles oligotrophus]